MQGLIMSHDEKLIGEVELGKYSHSRGIVTIPMNRLVTHKVENLCTTQELKHLNKLQKKRKELVFESSWIVFIKALYCSSEIDTELMSIVINKQRQIIKL